MVVVDLQSCFATRANRWSENLAIDGAIAVEHDGVSQSSSELCRLAVTVQRTNHECRPESLQQRLLQLIGNAVAVEINRIGRLRASHCRQNNRQAENPISQR